MKSYKTELKWGAIILFITLIWQVVERALGLHNEHIDKHLIYTNFIFIPYVIAYIFALKENKNKNFQGRINFMESAKVGFRIAAIAAILSPVASYLTHKFISPNYFQNIIDYSVSNGNQTLEKAEAYFNLKSYILQGAFGALIVGVILSGVISYFIKNK